MTAAVRTRRGNLEAGIHVYRHPDGRTATLVGMVHVAEPSYHRRVEAVVAELEAAGATVQYEKVSPPPPDARPTEHERELLDRLAAAKGMGSLASLLGLGLQHDEALEIRPGWVNTDINLLEFLRAIPDPDGFVERQESSSTALRDLDGMGGRRKAVMRWLLLWAVRHLPLLIALSAPLEWTRGARRAEQRVMVDLRNCRAANAIAAAPGDVVALWGAAHLPGIGEHLRCDGFALDERKWLTALRKGATPARHHRDDLDVST